MNNCKLEVNGQHKHNSLTSANNNIAKILLFKPLLESVNAHKPYVNASDMIMNYDTVIHSQFQLSTGSYDARMLRTQSCCFTAPLVKSLET